MRFVAMILGLFAVLALTLAVMGLPVGPSLGLLWEGAAGDRFALARTLVKATPLLLVALGVVVAWRARVYNIGGEGQYVVGALGAATVARLLPEGAGGLGTAAMLAAAVGFGGAWAALAGWLYVRRGVEVVISTILLNFVAFQLLGWEVEGPLKERAGQVPQTDRVPEGAMLFRPDRQLDLHAGTLLALLAAVGLWLFLYRTRPGYELRLAGENARLARAYRLDAARAQLGAMWLSGALCGLAGAGQYLGTVGRLGTTFPEGWGFFGIPVAILGGLHPLGVLPSALFFGALFAGSDQLARFTPAGASLVYVIQAVSVLAFVGLRGVRLPRRRRGDQEVAASS